METPEKPPLPTPPEALLARLEAMGLAHTLYHHEAVFTVEESEHHSLQEIFK